MFSLPEYIARDATGAFTDVGHSTDAVELKKQYLIGVVGSKSSGPPDSAQSAAASSTTPAASST
jgi:cytochrome b involved in lipid metabolism